MYCSHARVFSLSHPCPTDALEVLCSLRPPGGDCAPPLDLLHNILLFPYSSINVHLDVVVNDGNALFAAMAVRESRIETYASDDVLHDRISFQ